MAVFNSPFFSGQVGPPKGATTIGATPEVVDITYNVLGTGVETATSTINLVRLQDNMLILNAYVEFTLISAATGTTSIGTSGDADAFFLNLATTAAGRAFFDHDTQIGLPILTANTDIIATINTAAYTTAGTIRLVLLLLKMTPE